MNRLEILKEAMDNWEGGVWQERNCELCGEYDLEEDGVCADCPLGIKWGRSCNCANTPWKIWRLAKSSLHHKSLRWQSHLNLDYKGIMRVTGLKIFNDLKELYEEEKGNQ